MKPDWLAAWLAVTQHPFFSIGITLGCYQLAMMAYEKTRLALLQPVMTGMLMVIGLLQLFDIGYRAYMRYTDALTMLLGPAIVALAVPLYLNIRRIRSLLRPVLITLMLAGLLATATGTLLAWLFGAGNLMQMTLLTKSVTSPFSIMLADSVGGIPALAAVFSILTGILGGIFGPDLLRLIGVTHPAARGMALGLTAHAVGTARALQEGEECGAFSALAMSLMGVSTAILLPIAVSQIS